MKLGSPKSPRQTVAFLHDLGMAAAAFMIALLLRLGDEAWRSLMTELWPPMLLFTAVCGIVFLTTGLYRGVWRYASMNDLVAIVKAVSLRSEEHTSELQSLMRISYAVFCLKKN